MASFDLSQNFTPNPELLMRRVHPRVIPPQISLSAAEPVIQVPSASQVMAQKTLRDYSAPSANQVPTRPEVNTRGENFEIKMGLIMMVQASPFCGKTNEDASAHLQQFLELCSTFVIKGVSQDAIRLRLFLFCGLDSENPYHQLREFEQVCSCRAIAGMSHDTLKWKLFPFSLVEKAKQWYAYTVGSVNGS